MNVVQTPAVDIIIRNMGDDDRLQIEAWLNHLRNWDKDSIARNHAEKVPNHEDAYVLKISKEGLRIIFHLEPRRIKILDVTNKAAIMQFREIA